jgi:drug/metabolite transporter (DMT)-like permease
MKAKNLFQYILGGAIVIGFFLLLYFLIFSGVPEGNKDLLNLVVGALIGSFATVVGYFYGSSLGSSDKNELLKNGVNGK